MGRDDDLKLDRGGMGGEGQGASEEPVRVGSHHQSGAVVVVGGSNQVVHPCPFCSATFPDQWRLLQHFGENHYSDDEDEEESDSDSENELKGEGDDDGGKEEGEPATLVNFVTDYERALLSVPVFPLLELGEGGDDDEEDEVDTGPEQEDDDEDNFEEVIFLDDPFPTRRDSRGDEEIGGVSVPPAPPPSPSSTPTRETSPPPPSPSPGRKLKAPAGPTALQSRRRKSKLPVMSPSSSSGRPESEDKVNVSLQEEDWGLGSDLPWTWDWDPPAIALKNEQDQEDGLRQDFECVFCQRSYPSEDSLLGHLRAHTMEEPYFCKLCQDECFGQKEELTKHMQTQHPGNGRTFSSKHKISSPETTISIPGKVEKLDLMDEPRQRFYEALAKSRLAKQVPSSAPSNFGCPLCSRGFALMSELEDHMTMAHRKKKEARKLECNYCKIRFYWKCNLANHTRRLHSCLVVLDGAERDRLDKVYNLRRKEPVKRVLFKEKSDFNNNLS